MIYDMIIVGGGPAGLSCGVYSGRAGYSVLILEKIGTGGQMMTTDIIDNFPGFNDGITGFELQDRMVKQCEKFKVKFEFDDVLSIEKKDNIFYIKCAENEYQALSLVICSGASHRHLGVKGETEFAGKGVSYCGTCDAPFFRDKDVVVVGGGDSALTEALFIAKFAKSIRIIHRKSKFRAVDSLVKQAEHNDKISFIFNSVVEEIRGVNFVEGVSVRNLESQSVNELKTDAVFIFVGLDPNSSFLPKSILDEGGYVVTDYKMATSIKGVYAAGDIKSNAFRQIVCAASDGATAAFYAGEYIESLKGHVYK